MNITCYDLYGKQVAMAKEKPSFRPSVYGLIIHEQKLLVCNTRSTGKYFLPGGGVNIGEQLEEALHREVLEECGVAIEIERFYAFEERFFHYNPLQVSWQVLAFIYTAKPLSTELTNSYAVPGDESKEAEWVPIYSLTEDKMQVFGKQVMSYLQTYSS